MFRQLEGRPAVKESVASETLILPTTIKLSPELFYIPVKNIPGDEENQVLQQHATIIVFCIFVPLLIGIYLCLKYLLG